MERARKWLPQPEIDFACADISYGWPSGKEAALTVVMHFSRIANGYFRDLEIQFRNLLAFSWEDESIGLLETPEDLPKCSGQHGLWTYPTIVVENSRWAARYANRKYCEDDPRLLEVTHYILVSLNDLVHVLVEAEPESRWIRSGDH